jgi:hypothetical protein
MFFGWGTKRKQWNLSNGYFLICAYNYFHIMFILRVIIHKKWFIISSNRAEDKQLSKEDFKLLFPDKKPVVNAYYSQATLPAYIDFKQLIK